MASAGVADAPRAAASARPRSRGSACPAASGTSSLALVVLASVINGGALYLVQLGALGAFDQSFFLPATGLAVLVLGMHVALRWLAPDADPFILPIATVLNGLGIAAIYRLDLAGGYSGWESVAVRQIVWSGLAIVCALAVIVLLKNHRVLQRYRYIAMFVGLILLLLPMLPFIGQNINGARVWIHIGGFSFQPGEIAKICLAVFFAGYLVTARDSLSMVGVKVLGMRFPRVRDLGPILLVWAASMSVLVFQRDLGTSLLYFGLFIVMTYVSTGRIGWVVLGAVLFLGGAYGASTLGYVGGRVDAWLKPFDPAVYDANGGSYQLVTGLFGMADGGLFGRGSAAACPTSRRSPTATSSSRASARSLGLTGVFAILALYLLLVSRGFRIGFAGQDDFGKLLGIGLSFVIALQVFIVIGGVTRVIPLTGLTTPFMAAGGSSLLANWIIAALLLRLSDTVRNQPRLVVES
ncbi:FtsW/RodA/SpoVE family cell cycle protein [Clavibacter tessellarius]|uniref:FtsW/RodA/SpoVE family cell cycle protein n=1 Tax=Clavibacter tessellarius TaxID=31965 RepID=UPI00324689AF